jgi:methyl-accepting chemotaxis protein
MEDLVTKKFGAVKWKESLKNAGFSDARLFSTLEDVADAQVLALMKGIADAGSLTMNQVMDAFGEHWSSQFAPKLYSSYFAAAKSTRELLLSLDKVHTSITRVMKSARPPHFTYEWQGDKHLVMHYQSGRGLIALMPGLIHGLGTYYKDRPSVRIAGNAVHVEFA